MDATHLAELVDSAAAIVVVVDDARTLLLANRAWLSATGMTEPQAAGNGYLDAIHPEDRNRLLASWDMCRTLGTELDVKCRLRRADASYRQVLLQAARHDGRWIMTGFDVEDLLDQGRVRSDLIGRLAHELRTPLNGILGWAHLLRSGRLPPERQTRALESIERLGRAQASLIEEMLDDAVMTLGKLRLRVEPADLGEIVRGAVDALRPTAEARGVAVTVDFGCEPGAMNLDGARLRQAIWNLLSNAIKFTPAGGTVHIGVARVGGELELAFVDSGLGMSREVVPLVFDRYRQGDPASGKPGIGLGLSIAREIVELHGGSIHAHSDGPGKGSTFTIRLPARGARVRESQPIARGTPVAVRRAAKLAGKRILLVDEQPEARARAAEQLRNCGADIVAVASVQEAVAALATSPRDLLISSTSLPGGIIPLTALRALGLAPRGAVALVDDDSESMAAKAESAGYAAAVKRAEDPTILVAALTSAD